MSDNKTFKIIFAIFAVLLAHFYPELKRLYYKDADYLPIDASEETRSDAKGSLETDIIGSWKSLIQLPNRNINRSLKIAIGLNTNVDLIISGVRLLNELKFNARTNPQNHKSLNDLNQFKECFGHYFRKGSAAERSFHNAKDFEAVIESVKKLDNQQWFIGGNAGLMAQSISKRFSNAEILLIGPVGPRLKQLLNKNIKVPPMTLIEEDEIHLILEYNAHEIFEDLQSPTANRFIVSHDIYNSRMEMLDQFFNITKSYKPDVVILSGLHLLESQSEEFRMEKLLNLRRLLMENNNLDNVVHLELASIGDKSLMKSILENGILQQINSLGLNEQELLFLSHSSSSDEAPPHSNYYNELEGQPELHKVVDILEWILHRFGSPGSSKLTRVHFHSLTFHVIAEASDDTTSVWSNSVASLMSGAKIASKQACGFDFNDEDDARALAPLVEFKTTTHGVDGKAMQPPSSLFFKISDDKNVHNVLKFNSSSPVLEFSRGRVRFLFTPVLVCKSPVKTVGLGDAISSNGLLYAVLNRNVV